MHARRSALACLVVASSLAATAHAAPASAPPAVTEEALGPHDPLAGVAGEQPFVRSPGGEIVLFPGFLGQVRGAFFPQSTDLRSGFSLHRARLELSGWLGPMFYFDVAGDFATAPAAPGGHPPSDAFVAFAPQGDTVILQAGQFDTPFSLENRTYDAYLPFIERSLAVRALTVPYNKDLGVMVHGTDAARTFYYSGGVFNGDGPGVANGDNRVDVIGRVTVSPFARSSIDILREWTLGGSAWYGRHVAGRSFPTQTTPGGFVFFDPVWTVGQAMPTTLDLHESGRTITLGGELSLPLGHQAGLRAEGFFKTEDLAEDSIAADGSTLSTLGRANLTAIGGYADAWLWLVGDDRLLPRPGYELPRRLGRLIPATPEHGLMLAARGEILKEDLTSGQSVNADPNLATTRVVATTLGMNYWYGRRVRASFNYILTLFSGSTENIKAIAANSKSEHEFLLLLSMGL